MHSLTPFEAKLLSDAVLLEHTQALLKRVEKMRDTVRKKLEENPQVNDNEMRLDFRYCVGYVNAMNEILDIPNKARTFLTNTG